MGAHRYHSSGKLLLTGEYLVLHGASALAVPTRLGQLLEIRSGRERGILSWETRIRGRHWFSMEMDTATYRITRTNLPVIGERLVHMLREAAILKGSGDWLENSRAKADIEFDMEWGLGSSSSLISNIAYWSEVDPFLLHGKVSGGSACDIAAARSGGPVLYMLDRGSPKFREVTFRPPYLDRVGFVYLGRKQKSSQGVRSFLKNAPVRQDDILKVSEISRHIMEAGNLDEFEDLVRQHEGILSGILDRVPVQEALFPDFKGVIKSLGAWGGDFALFTCRQGWTASRNYFEKKGLTNVFKYPELVKSGLNDE